MIYEDIEQGSPEWHSLRLGKVTASRVVNVLPGVKGKYLAGRKNYMSELICEILTGKHAEHFVSGPMQWGTDTEPLGRTGFEIETGLLVKEVAFATHPTIKDFGASPDGLIGDNSGIEIKCPETAQHIDVLLNHKVKRDYVIQMNVNMICTERNEWYYVDFDPRLPDKLSIVIIPFKKDPVLCAEIEMEVKKFLDEMNTKLKLLRGLN